MPKRCCTQLFATALGLLLPATLLAQQQPGSGERVLPNFDSRLTIPRQGAARPETQAAVEQLRAETGPDAQARLGADGSVRTVAAHGRPLTPRGVGAAEDVARRFLARHARAFGLEPADVAGLTAGAVSSRGASGLVAIELRQFVQGIRVFGAGVRVYLTPAGEIVRVTSSTAPRGAAAAAVTLTPERAARIAAADIRPELEAPGRVLRGPDGLDRRTVLDRGAFAADVEVALVWFPAPGSLRLAWQVRVEPPGLAQKYDVLIDAATGELLYRRNRVLYAQGSGRVLQSDATHARDPRLADEHPAGAAASGPGDAPNGCPPVANHLTRSLTTPFRDASTVLSGTGRLEGNNAHVFRGAVGVEAVSGTMQGDGARLFDFPFGSAGSAETHLFFTVNFLHDFFYDLGFDEASGNFQQDNLGRGGAGGDRLHALARADGRNNASFEPRPEGESPIMSMFLFDGEGCWSSDVDGDGMADLDGDFDSDIVIHEYHHGVSWRLNPEFTGIEADAIGEGGGDFFAYSINGDTRLAEYAVPGVGIREINGRTYGSWWCWFGLFCEPHDNGEIWADVLWDLRERFRADLVDGSEAAAVRHAHVVYLEGLRLSPPSPTMLDVRDAMLQADALLRPSGGAGGSANFCRIWDVFALRGMGLAALDTNDTGDATVVESSSMPSACPALPAPAPVTITATDSTAAEAGLDPGTFMVARSGSTTRALTIYLAPGGSAVPGADYVPLPSTITIAEGASSATVTVTPIDDAIVESNETVSLSLTDGPGYQVSSPGGATVVITSDDVAPDLAVSALTGPAAAGAGVAIAVTETTKNQGTGDTTASVTRYYLSVNGTVDVADAVLGSRSVPALAVAAFSAATVTLTIPAGTAPGTYYIIAMADADGAIGEIVETNNQRSVVTRIGPDLQTLGVTVPSTAAAGAAIVVGDTTRNKGGGAAGASTTSFFLSVNSTYEATDAALGSRGVPALAAGASHAAQTTVTIPAGTAAGTYYLIALADAANAVAETTETDNASQALVRVGSDLTVSALVVPATTGAGLTVIVADTTKNAGGGASVESVTRFLLSTNSTLDAADVSLAERPVPGLPGNGSHAATTPVTIPPGTVAGVYYLLAQADAAAGNAEVTETNNLKAVQVRVGPDLVVIGLGAPSSVAAGAGMTVTDTAKNQGGGVASASSVGLYWSSNTTLDGSDAALGSRSVPSLEAGTGSSSGSTQVVVPAGAAPGTYYLIARADRDGDVVESNETNNAAYVVIHVGPDLHIAQATLSSTSVAAGGTVVLTDTTQNSGGAVAPPSTSRAYLSTNTTLDVADTVLGSRTLAGLAAGEGQAGTMGITIPPGTAPGRWYVIVKADADGVVAESYESNNTQSVLMTVN